MRNAGFWLVVTILLVAGCSGGTSKQSGDDTTTVPPAAVPTDAAGTAKPTPSPGPARSAIRIDPGGKISITPWKEISWVSVEFESIEPDPDEPDDHGGDGATLRLRVDGLELTLTDLPEGYGSQRVSWQDDVRIELVEVGGPPSAFAKLYVDQVGKRVVDGSEREVRVERKGKVEIGPQTELRFTSHGHKRTYPGQQSPLIVRVEYLVAGKLVDDETQYNLYPPKEPDWRWREYRFELLEWEYGDWMRLRIHRYHLEPVEPR